MKQNLNRLQKQENRSLRHLVFQSWNAQWPCRPIRFRDEMPPHPHRWRNELLILLLLGDSRIAKGASPKTMLDEEPMQIAQSTDIGAGHANLHAGASGRIQHPGRQHDDHARRRLDVNNPAAGTLLAVLLPKTPTVEGMPTIMDLHFLPDMGRMNG